MNSKFNNDINKLPPPPPPRIFSRKNHPRLIHHFFKKYSFSQCSRFFCSKLFSPKSFTVSFKKLLTKKRQTKSTAGFSLVELMVVVAIIGVLATIAVPQLNKWVVKAKQAEAKSNLSGLFAAMKGFKTLHGVYHGNFNAIGFQPDGQLVYTVGFGHNYTKIDLPNGMAPSVTGSNRTAINFNTKDTDICDSNSATTRTKSCKSPSIGIGGDTGIFNSWTVTKFTAQALGDIDGKYDGGNDDFWHLNQDKILEHWGDDITGVRKPNASSIAKTPDACSPHCPP